MLLPRPLSAFRGAQRGPGGPCPVPRRTRRSARGLWRRCVPSTGSFCCDTIFGSFFLQLERSNFLLTVLANMADPRVSDTQLVANMLEAVLRESCSELIKVEELVKTIHTQLACVSWKPLQDILRRTLLQVAHLNPGKVVAGLLQASPLFDNTARAMWKTLACEPSLVQDVLKALLCISHQCSRLHSITGGGSCHGFLSVASAMHEVFLVPSSRRHVQLLLDELFMAVLLQISCSLEGPQKGCCCSGRWSRKAKHPSVPRTAVSTMQALFQCLGGASLVEDMGRQGAWDMLVSAETYHSGVTVLTRVLRREAPDCCPSVSEQAVIGLLQRQAEQDIGAMTVFVELLDCTNLEHVQPQVLYVLWSHLEGEDLVLRRLAARSLVALSGRPEKAATLQGLLPEVMQRLQDSDCDISTAALTVLGNVLGLADRQRAVPIALQLLTALLPLFENESSYVRERSILLYRAAMEVAVSSRRRQTSRDVQMRQDVQRSLMPLFFHLHDKDQSVAQASQEALLGALKFLKRRQLRKLLQTEHPRRVGQCLLEENSGRAEQYLQQSLPYLQSPQEPLREAAVRFIGLAGQQLRDGHQERRQERLQVIYDALEGTAEDSSLSVSSLAAETLLNLKAAAEEPPSGFRLQALCSRLRRAWRRRTLALGGSWLCCWSCARS